MSDLTVQNCPRGRLPVQPVGLPPPPAAGREDDLFEGVVRAVSGRLTTEDAHRAKRGRYKVGDWAFWGGPALKRYGRRCWLGNRKLAACGHFAGSLLLYGAADVALLGTVFALGHALLAVEDSHRETKPRSVAGVWEHRLMQAIRQHTQATRWDSPSGVGGPERARLEWVRRALEQQPFRLRYSERIDDALYAWLQQIESCNTPAMRCARSIQACIDRLHGARGQLNAAAGADADSIAAAVTGAKAALEAAQARSSEVPNNRKELYYALQQAIGEVEEALPSTASA